MPRFRSPMTPLRCFYAGHGTADSAAPCLPLKGRWLKSSARAEHPKPSGRVPQAERPKKDCSRTEPGGPDESGR